MSKICILTGISGYVGTAVAELLLERGFEVRALARSDKSVEHLSGHIEIYMGDILDKASLAAMFENTGDNEVYVVHAAAVVSVKKHDEQALHINIEGTQNIVELCEQRKVKKLVYVSSTDALHPRKGIVTREPDFYHSADMASDYARSKAEASKLVVHAARTRGLNATLVLPSCVLGPGDYKGGFTSQLITLFAAGMPPVSVEGGYDFVDVRDVARLTVDALDDPLSGESYLATGEYATITDVFNLLAEQLGRHKIALTLPTITLRAVNAITKPYYLVANKPSPFTRNSIDLLASGTRFSHAKASAAFGYTPRPLRETVNDTLHFILDHPEIYHIKPKTPEKTVE